VGESAGQRRRRGERRSARLSVRLNGPELGQLRQRARARGLSVTRLLVDAALAQPIEPGDPGAATSGAGPAEEQSEVFEGVEQRRRRGEDRSMRLSVRLNGRERDDLAARARVRGLSVTRLLVDGALEVPLPAARSPVDERSRELLGELVGRLDALDEQLVRVGNNLNQMAHGVNISRELQATAMLDRALGEWHERLAEVRGVVVDADRLLRGLPRLARD
jgi:post-segregation antitoxin (ccd killing protein)